MKRLLILCHQVLSAWNVYIPCFEISKLFFFFKRNLYEQVQGFIVELIQTI